MVKWQEGINMAFRQGSGDEKLLTCKVCLSEFEIDGKFCSNCGIPRLQALGVESTSESTNEPQVVNSQAFPDLNGISTFASSILDKVKSSPKALLNNKFVSSIRSIPYHIGQKYSLITSKIELYRRYFQILTGFLLIISSYAAVQSLIFSSEKPDKFIQQYINAVSNRDTSAINKNSIVFPNPDNLQILPTAFNNWKEISEESWQSKSNWNGWLGNGEIELSLKTSNFPPKQDAIWHNPNFKVRIKANYFWKFGIFRGIEWVAKDDVPIIEIGNISEKRMNITLNRGDGGTTESKKIDSGRYAALPGPLQMSLTGDGFTKQRLFEGFLTNGTSIVPKFEPVSYELSSSQLSAASSRIRSLVESCLRKSCSKLPDLSTYDFDFYNQPSSYLYVDYLNVSWSNYANCTNTEVYGVTINTARVSMTCSTSASAYVKWILYRLFFTTYYDTGYDSKDFTLNVSATIKPKGYGIEVTSINIS